MKKIYKITSSLVLILVLVFSFGAWNCGPIKPWEYDNVIWYSVEPFMEFSSSIKDDWQGTIKNKDETMSVQMVWGPSSFAIEHNANEGEIIVEGKLIYDKHTVTLIVQKDDFFNYEYEEIVLKRRNIQ